MAIRKIFNFLMAIFLFSWPIFGVPQSETAGQDLSSLMAKAAEYCHRLTRSVMDFTCREQVKEWIGPGDLSSARNWFYDYQLIRKNGSIRENRILLNDNGREVNTANAPLQTQTFSYAYVVMGPLGLLSRVSQAKNDFRIVREEKVGGETAIVIEAAPKPGARLDHLFGTVWVRKADARILKIEWNPSSMDNYAGIEAYAKENGLKPKITMTSEYGFEKNGIFFPSHYTIKEDYVGGNRSKRLIHRSQVDVTYDRYKFFTVETEVNFK